MVRKLLISTILILGLVESLFSKDFESETKFDNINFDTKLLKYYYDNDKKKCQTINEKESQELEAHFKDKTGEIEIAYKTPYGYMYMAVIFNAEAGRIYRISRSATEEACNFIPEVDEQEKVRFLELNEKREEVPSDIEHVNPNFLQDATARYKIAEMYYSGEGVKQNYEEAARWFKLSALNGNTMAQLRLGDMYYYGKVVKQNYNEAAKWYKILAEQGSSHARNNLGDMYYYGKGGEQNHGEAFKWFKLSAEQGDSSAQNILGFMYANAKGVKQDFKKAMDLFKKACDGGSENGCQNYKALSRKSLGL